MRTGGSQRGSCRRTFGFTAALLLLAPCAAFAQIGPDMDRCDAGRRAVPPAERIAACSVVIESSRSKPAERALAYSFRAVAFRQSNDHARAIADHDEAIRLDPRSSAAFKERALTWQRHKDYERAIADFDQAIRLEPKNAALYNQRGYVWHQKRDPDRAIADHTEAIRINRGFSAAYNDRGLSLRAKGHLDRAMADFDRAIELAPKNLVAINNRGLTWRAKGDLDRAIADHTLAIRIDPKAVPAYVHRGLAYEARNAGERAKADYNAALMLTPSLERGRRAQETARIRLALLAADPAARPSPGVAAGDAGRRIALVIGNAVYKAAGKLANPVNDARAVAAALRDLRFEVAEGTDLNHLDQERLMRDFLRSAATARVALLFFAGHGLQVEGKNYLLPVDARLAAPKDLAFETLELDRIIAGLDDETRTNIVILDACRDNPLGKAFPSSRRTGSGLASISVGSGLLVAFATKPDAVAIDGAGDNSPFTAALVNHIRTPGLEIRQMLTRVRVDVRAATQDQQITWDNSSLLGDVYLAGAPR